MNTKLENAFKAPSHIAENGTTEALVSPSPLFGTWVNINQATRDLVKIIIAASGTGISVEVFGACTPTPCNWGSVGGTAYAANVSSIPAVSFTAQYEFNFADVIVTGRHHGRELLVETFTQFTDGSGRSNLYTADTMLR